MEKEFPNGFTSWHETHYEVVMFLTIAVDSPVTPKKLEDLENTKGFGGFYELAEELTDEFELLYKGKKWDGEFFDLLQSFLEHKIYSHNE